MKLTLLLAATVPAALAFNSLDDYIYQPHGNGICFGHDNDFPASQYPDFTSRHGYQIHRQLGPRICTTEFDNIGACYDLCDNTEGCTGISYRGQGGQDTGCCFLQSTSCDTLYTGSDDIYGDYVSFHRVKNRAIPNYPISIFKSAKYWYDTGLYFSLQTSPCAGSVAVKTSQIKSVKIETKTSSGAYSLYQTLPSYKYSSGGFNMGNKNFPSQMRNFRFVTEYTADDGRQLTYYDYYDNTVVEPQYGENRRGSSLQVGYRPCTDNFGVGGNSNYRPHYTVVEGLVNTLDPLPQSLVATGCTPFVQSDDDPKVYTCNKDGTYYRFSSNACS